MRALCRLSIDKGTILIWVYEHIVGVSIYRIVDYRDVDKRGMTVNRIPAEERTILTGDFHTFRQFSQGNARLIYRSKPRVLQLPSNSGYVTSTDDTASINKARDARNKVDSKTHGNIREGSSDENRCCSEVTKL